LRYTGEVGQREIDFFFISRELRRVGAKEESALKKEVVEFVRIGAVEDIRNAGLRLMGLWC